MAVFDALDSLGGRKGYLTVDDFKNIYSTSQHPAVVSGQLSRTAALQQFIAGFGGDGGTVSYEQWLQYYEEVSCLIESDDLFNASMATAWKHVKKKVSETEPPKPVISYVSTSQLDALEAQLKKSIYQKMPNPESDPRRKVRRSSLTCPHPLRRTDLPNMQLGAGSSSRQAACSSRHGA